MRNKFLLLVVLGLALFAACSDDDKKDSPEDVNGTYSTGSTSNALVLNYSKALLEGKTVEVTTNDDGTATFKLNAVVPGEQQTVFSNVALVRENSAYTFTSENRDAARAVSIEGNIQNGKLTLDVDVQFARVDLMNTWDFSSVKLSWTPHDYSLTKIQVGRIEMNLTTGLLATMAPAMLKKELAGYLQNVTFRQDGNIVATYNAAKAEDDGTEVTPSWQESPLNLAQFSVKDGICYVYLNIDMIMRQVDADQQGRATGPNILEGLEDLLANGIPVHFEVTAGNALSVSVDQDLLKQLGPLVPMISGLVPDDAGFEATFIGTTVSVPFKPILENLPGALEATTAMEVGLGFTLAQ